MRRLTLVIALLALSLVSVACAASQPPGWTFAPPTPAPPSQPAASGDGSAAPASPAEPTPVPGGPSPSGGGGAGTVEVSALNVSFEQTAITTPAGAAFVIHFDNKDAGVPHNVEIKDASSTVMFKGDIVNGVAAVDYQVPALAAGMYQFVCTVHPNMAGTLHAGG
jgi:plastocyanin